MPRRFLILVPVVAVFVVAAVALFSVRPPAELGKPPASFTLPLVPDAGDVDGPTAKLTLDDLVGSEPVVVNFWASWCEPCIDEADELKAAAEDHPDVSFVGVNIRDGRGPASRFIAAREIPYPSVNDERGVTAKRFGVTGLPETIFIDERGLVAGRYIGAIDARTLERLIEDLVALERGELLDITGSGESQPVP